MGNYDLFFALILIGTLILLILDKYDKTIVSMTGAGLALFFAILPNSSLNGDMPLIPDTPALVALIRPDLLFIIIGMTLMVGVTAQTGIFDYIALKLLKMSNGNSIKLLIFLSSFTLLLSTFMDAYTTIVIIGSITLASTQGLLYENGNPINSKPYLIAEGIFSNIGSMLTRVSSPPNLILGGHYNISFLEFTLFMSPIVIMSVISAFIMISYFFRKELRMQISTDSTAKLLAIDEKIVVKDWKDFYKAAIIILLTILGFIFSSYLNQYIKLELGYIAMAGGFASVAFLIHSHENREVYFHKVEWSIVFFFAGLLLLINLVAQVNLLEQLAIPFESMIKINPDLGMIVFIVVNTGISAVLDNTPMAALLTGIIDGIKTLNVNYHPFLWAAVMVTNLGGNLTPIGSVAVAQSIQLLNKETSDDNRVKFLEFMKVGFLCTIPALIFGTFYILLLSSFYYS